MNTILIVDHTDYKNELQKYLLTNYTVLVAESAYDAITTLNMHDVDLVISQVELPGDNAFDLYNYLQKHYTYIPAIMITEKDIDTFFDKIFSQGIGNVLKIPVNMNEFTSLVNKIISRKNIFGLEHYVSNILNNKAIRINSSKQIQPAVDTILATIESWGFTIANKSILYLILNEMIINAVYHSHGYTQEKEMRIPIELKEGQFVDITFCCNPTTYAIAITDYQGTLTKEKILQSIHKAIEQEQLILKAAQTGEDISDKISETGRGIDLMRKLASEFYFVIHRNKRTEIILLFDSDQTKKSSSLKIIENIQ
ncbi:MAG: response regulator [Spirochaetes bacterium]|nr:response regulator [Spirochaetota bacterium]